MQELFVGGAIRLRRLELGLTQEQVCDRICDPATLSRIENGRQTPSHKKAIALLERLGLSSDKYYVPPSASEAETEALRGEIETAVSRFHQSLGEEKRQARLEALDFLSQLEAITDPEDNIGRQYILAMRTGLGKEDGLYDFETKLNMLLEAIRMTVPRFRLETLGNWLYSVAEADIIRQIAETYSEAGEHEKAAGILNRLLTYVQEHNQDTTHPSWYLPPAALSCARELCLAGHYEEALKTAELGRITCLDFGFCQLLPELVAVMAECRYAMGELEASRDLLYQVYHLFKVTGNASGLAKIVEEARKRLDPEFPQEEVPKWKPKA